MAAYVGTLPGWIHQVATYRRFRRLCAVDPSIVVAGWSEIGHGGEVMDVDTVMVGLVGHAAVGA